MGKAKLNQHFAKIAFLLWNLVLHSLCLSALFTFSEGRNFSTLWSENQLFLASLSIGLFALIYRDEWISHFKKGMMVRDFLYRGFLLSLMVSGFGLWSSLGIEKSQFLGFSSQISMNFLAAYSWIFRSILLAILCFSLNATTQTLHPKWTGLLLQFAFFWIWFKPDGMDLLFLTGAYFLHSSFLFSSAFLGGTLILTHAVFGSEFMGNEFVGLFQFKWPREPYSLIHTPTLILGLFFILGTNKLKRYLKRRKESPAT